MVEVACEWCRKSFTAKRSSARFCSPRHRYLAAQNVSKGLERLKNASPGTGMPPETRNAVTSTNVKQGNALTSANKTLRVSSPRGNVACRELAFELLEEPGISFGCSYPKQVQAEIVSGDQGRRHPYEGDRPQWSGYCADPDCGCKCHGDEEVKSKPMSRKEARRFTERNVLDGKQGRCDLERYPA